MRKIEEEMRYAIMNRKPFMKGNTEFRQNSDGIWELFLHGNKIAKFENNNSDKPTEISFAGWVTVTTKSRLNALDGVHINVKNFIPYLNGKKLESKENRGWVGWCDWFKVEK